MKPNLATELSLIIQRAENAEAALVEAEKQLTIERGWNCQGKARLAEADALLREALDALPTKSDYESRVQYLRELRDRIDAHLAREPK